VVGRGDATFMVGSTAYLWRTSYWCATDFYVSGAPKTHAPRIYLPPFLENGPTELCGAWKCGVPRIRVICMAHSHIMRHGCGGLTPPVVVPIGAHTCVVHLTFGAPRIAKPVAHILGCVADTYPWSTKWWCAADNGTMDKGSPSSDHLRF
jgi:hypothetical protein